MADSAAQTIAAPNPIPQGMAEQDANTVDPVFSEAKRRFAYAVEVESYARKLFVDDLKFAEADSDNGWQWPGNIRQGREIEDRPCLTINITRQHNLQIINDIKQNRSSVRIRPTGNGATKEAADTYQDVVRHIEYQSRAQLAYDKAAEFQVKGGLGWWRLVTAYESDDSFDQEIFILPVNDSLSVFLDPDAQMPDKSDANWGFVYRNFPKDQFETLFPRWKDEASATVLGNDYLAWRGKNHIRVAEYFRRIRVQDTLLAWTDPQGAPKKTFVSSIGMNVARAIAMDPSLQAKHREVWRTKVEWYLIAGGETKDRSEWAGQYIPLIYCGGEEVIVDGRLDRKGHTRALKDPQRIYNYWNSSAVEQVALQSKTPYTGPAKAFEGYETYWNTANKVNHAWLPYNHIDDEGNPLNPPTRQPVPEMGQAYIQGLQISRSDMMSVSGQQEGASAEAGKERTGRAIAERARRGQNSTFHFIANHSMAIANTGRQLIDLIPKIYDTKRVIQCRAEDGTDYEVTIDPKAKQAFEQKNTYQGQAAQRIFNPAIGHYWVEADIGPNYATKREEAWNAYSIILTQAPGLVNVIGDLLFRAGDFPFAEEAAARLKRMVPQQAKEGGPSQEMLALQQQLQNTSNALAAALNDIAVKKAELEEKDRLRDTSEYDAETKRLNAFLQFIKGGKDGGTPGGDAKAFPGLEMLVNQLVMDAMDTHITKEGESSGTGVVPRGAPRSPPGAAPVGSAPGQHQMNHAPPVPGARLASDGEWYLPDDQRPGKYLRVMPQAPGLVPGQTPAAPEAPAQLPLPGMPGVA